MEAQLKSLEGQHVLVYFRPTEMAMPATPGTILAVDNEVLSMKADDIRHPQTNALMAPGGDAWFLVSTIVGVMKLDENAPTGPTLVS